MIWSVVHFVFTPGDYRAFIMPLRPHKASDQYLLKRSWSSHSKAKNGVFNGQLSQKYKLLDKVSPLMFLSIKELKVTNDSTNHKRVYKTDGVIFSKCITSLSCSGLSITKKRYFESFLGVSIKMYLLPGFESHTFKTKINVQLKSPCILLR
jgi:hypothetical protein